MSEIRWGVLGNANIARKCVLPALNKSNNGCVVALATRSPETAQSLAAEHGIARVYDDYQKLLDDPAIDAVYIPLPNHLHRPWTLKALTAGKHVLCEKPLAMNSAEAEQMAAAAGRADRLLMEAFMYRFHPRSRKIKALVSQGAIGKVHSVRCAFCFKMDDSVLQTGNNYRLDNQMGGGALMDVGCYGVSLARWLLGQEPVRVQAQAVYDDNGIDLHVAGILQFADGALATIEAGFITALQQTYSVTGSHGAIDVPHDAFIPWEKETVFTVRRVDDGTGQEHTIAGVDEYRCMVEHFSATLLNNTELDFAIQDSIANMRVIEALARSARSGCCEQPV